MQSLHFICQVFTSVFFCCCDSETWSCPTLCDPVDCSTPGLPVLHHLLEHAQTCVHWVGNAIQPFHPLLSSPPAFSLSQHQSLFQWVSFLHQMATILELQLQQQSFQWIFRVDLLQDWLFDLLAVQRTLESLLQHHSSKVSILQCSAFLWSSSHIHTWLLAKP